MASALSGTGVLAITLASLLFSASMLLVQLLSTRSAGAIGPSALVAARGVLQTLVLAVWYACYPFCFRAKGGDVDGSGDRREEGTPARWTLLLICARTALTVGAIGSEYTALASSPIGEASALFNTSSVWAAALSIAYLREPVSAHELWAIALAGMGVALLVLAREDAPTAAPHLPTPIVGRCFALLEAMTFAVQMAIVRRLGSRVSPATLTATLNVALIFMSPLLRAMEGWPRWPTRLDGTESALLVAAALVGLPAQMLIVYGTQRVHLAVASALMTSLEVLLGFAFDVALGERRVTGRGVSGALVIVAAATRLFVLRHAVEDPLPAQPASSVHAHADHSARRPRCDQYSELHAVVDDEECDD